MTTLNAPLFQILYR